MQFVGNISLYFKTMVHWPVIYFSLLHVYMFIEMCIISTKFIESYAG